MANGVYTRYVALGDSQTEGLWDGNDSDGVIGFADRLAAMLDGLHPGLHYANLAVRGRRIVDVLDDQLPRALAMRPDLISVCVGMNDITRPGKSFGSALAEFDQLHDRLAQSGATVVTTTFPDIGRIVPVGKFLTTRVLQTNEAIVSASKRYGFKLVDLYNAPSMTQPKVWSDDRVHGSTHGHMLFAAAAAEALGLPGSSHEWAQADPAAAQQPALLSRTYSQLMWTKNMFAPWLYNHVRGISTGDGRKPKRPEMASLVG
ncbi:SGNH/GDSL hydrolase family protein [Mycolicibacterium sp. 120270]|uniref:SGNH/GDSL hydrolase family protein n=1 Tax=Mycolicibacterium sp. 120270 TaxID=3090600 RepID=UPI00299E7D4F|nr:SGNH/GDSL hydrolase family protein [Mycolicibacterium sp. 120270]MDX1883619.1 SGNH/GDSL hydrolase family protein [Mycolicibacterium sp. 120270]